MPELPENLQRIFVLRSPEDREECVGSISHGPVPTVVDDAPPDSFVAMIHFAKMGPLEIRTYPDGRKFGVMPILDAPTKNRSRWRPFETAAEALALLEQERQALLAAGWLEGDFDPVNDPD